MPPAARDKARLPRDAYVLVIRQAPEIGKSFSGKEKDRKPIDPPPVIQLQIRDYSDPAQNFLQSPYYMCICTLWDAEEDKPASDPTLVGTLVSSLHRLKDTDNTDSGFFVFPDISVKAEGKFRLKFTLWELLDGITESLQSVVSREFTVHPAKTFPGLGESTFLTRSFSDQGVRLRIRKETRTSIKRSVTEAENGQYAPQHRDGAALPGQLGYGQPSPYAAGYGHDYPQGMVKRQKSAGGQGFPEREGWQYTQAQATSGNYGPPTVPPVSGYYQEPTTATQPMEFAYRPSTGSEGTIPPHSYYQRPHMSEYPPASAGGGYNGQNRHDAANGMSYAENGGQDMRSEYSSQAGDPGMRPQYRYTTQAGPSTSNTLPPITSPAPPPTGQSVSSTPPYSSFGQADARFPPPAVRPAYGPYAGQAFSLSANFTPAV